MRTCVLVLAWALAAALPAAAQDADIAGKWDVNMTTPQGPAPATVLVMKKDGDKLVGTFSSPQGELPVEASVKEKAVTIWFTVQTPNGPFSITMNGTADSDAMKGTVDFGGRAQGDWSAKRASAAPPAPAAPAASAPAKLDVSGTWDLEVATDAGAGTPTVTFKQDGESLTGRYTGQFGESAVTGTLKGAAIEFAIDVSAEGNSVHVIYSGTVDNGAIKGTVKFGDLANGTFTGKKK